MNHRITLQRRAPGVTSGGQPSKDWVDVATIWADVLFQRGAEVMRGGAEVTIKRASIRIRARTDVDAAWRVRYLGEVFDVKSTMPDVDRSFMFLVCEVVR